MASRRPIYTFLLTGYATESNEKNIFAVLCERHAINNIYKLISVLNYYLLFFMTASFELLCTKIVALLKNIQKKTITVPVYIAPTWRLDR